MSDDKATPKTGIAFHDATGDHLPAPLTADRPLYANADRSMLLEAGDPDAAWLVAAYPGSLIPGEWVRDMTLEMKGDKVVQAKPAKTGAKQSEPAKDKQAKPAKTKAK